MSTYLSYHHQHLLYLSLSSTPTNDDVGNDDDEYDFYHFHPSRVLYGIDDDICLIHLTIFTVILLHVSHVF